jgi:hypothetical protein
MTGEISSQLDRAEWLDLKRLSQYACVCQNTLRNWIHSPNNPLPASQRGNKIYVRKRDFDVWMRNHAIQIKTGADLTRIVDGILSDVARSRAR